ncbi:MAG: methyltransferase domain-containing protein [Alphaproteobacteria bacterium]|nr:methyltransferase domain-containing protein [Alphaproteobacteria bacterium]
MSWSDSARTVIDRLQRSPLGARGARPGGLMPEDVATALYRGILGREPDISGLADKARVLRQENTLELVIRSFVESSEFKSRFLESLFPPVPLPNLIAQMPERYRVELVRGGPMNVYVAESNADMSLMMSLIEKHRFYDRAGVWTPSIDLDKRITAKTVEALGARSCFELGCFNGSVLSVLAEAGIAVAGSEVSHLAFIFAYTNIRDKILYGDVRELGIDRVFDAVLCMDVLEHVNPVRLDDYIQKLLSVLAPDGVMYVNSPMWGDDRIFGVVEEPYLAEWLEVGDAANWRHWPCDGEGWPVHGHLVWASPLWWERKFAEHGLVRDTRVETVIHHVLGPTFETSPGRRSLFVLRREAAPMASETQAASVAAALSSLPGLPVSRASQS